MFSPVSIQAHAITTLMVVVFAICGAIFVLVAWLVTYGAIRYRSRGIAADPVQSFGSSRVEVLWTAGPLLLLLVIFGLTVSAGQAADPSTNTTTEPDVRLIGHQWWWEVQYPRVGVVTANEIHMPTKTRLLFELRSADVIHDFWVPQLGRKMDLVPGHPARLWVEADTAGTYSGACAEYCGAEHAWMRLRVVAEPALRFASWVVAEGAPAVTAPPGAAAEGERLFGAMTCANCHAIGGTPYDARIGPDLTHVATRERLAGELIDNTPTNLARWIAHPNALKPSSHMPNLHLSSDQVAALVAYMETLR
jgi:cytochrome c oxidase subunit 2